MVPVVGGIVGKVVLTEARKVAGKALRSEASSLGKSVVTVLRQAQAERRRQKRRARMARAGMQARHAVLAGLGVGAAVGVGMLVGRATRFTPPEEELRTPSPVDVDLDAATDALAQLVRCRTVSNADPALEDDAEFERLVGLLPTLYPYVWQACELRRFEGRALLFQWPGCTPGNPAVLMAHYDVVPVNESAWEHDPFGAEVVDGVMWGRGTLDTKVTLNGILSAANALIARGFVPEHDVYLAFSGGEEVYGPGAAAIVGWFAERGIKPELVLDEGGAVVTDVFPGVHKPCGLIGIAEKGVMNVTFTSASNGGHASAPKPGSPVARLASAADAVEHRPLPMHLSEPAAQMFDTLGRHAGLGWRVVFANVDLLAPVLDLYTRLTGGELNALLRTTVALTQMQGSDAANVIPSEATIVSNVRIGPDDTVDGVLEHLRSAIGDKDVQVEATYAQEPSPVSRTDCEGYRRVANAVADTWPGCVVSPYLMVQCSDSRHYRDLSDRVYRFSACDMTAEERATIHGDNERIRVECIGRAVEFFTRVLEQC